MKPSEFWDATIDECILTIRGHVDRWRVQRNMIGALMKFQAGEKVSLLEDIPLPFDWEYGPTKSDEEELIAGYEALRKSGALG